MTKEKYIQEEVSTLLRSLFPLLAIVGASTDILLCLLDYFVTPENFSKFLIYRLITAFLTIAVYFASRFHKGKYYIIFVFLGYILTGAMVEAMILSFGGHQSIYYVGMGVILAFFLSFLPLSLGQAALIAASLYAIYLIPIIIVDDIVNIRVFINNNIFLITFALGGLTWRYFAQKLLINKISLQYDLEEKKKHLEVYSHQLEGMVQDRTKELTKSNQWHQSLMENAIDGIMVMDRNGIIMNVNQRSCEMHGFGRDALVGTHSNLLEVDENRQKAAERLQELLRGNSLVYETSHYRKDGSRMAIEVSAKAIPIADEVFIQAFQRDITEKKKIQEHLFQSQKMDSIGMLAGGIAHDFNNILTAILGYTGIIRKDVGANEKVLSRLGIIENAARKAGRMVSQLLGFSRKSEFEFVPLNLNDVVADTVKLLERMMDQRITLQLDLGKDLPLVDGDFNQLKQVVMNFLVNARDAMPYGGTITVATASVEAGPGVPDVPPYVPAGRYVLLKATDTGVGIPEEIQRKIFEPFFTTKERGKGTGLGLAMVYGVVTEHKGFVTVQSRINQGTTFTVFLPASAKTAAAAKKPAPVAVRGNETILLVDDDEAVLGFVKETLEMNGYKVIATANPVSALDAFKKLHSEIAMVITDVVMPLIDGRELMKHMRDADPSARFLTVSGYSRYAERADDVKPDVFLQKPFEPWELLSAVRRIIDRGKALHAF